jgi:hypothetical protein
METNHWRYVVRVVHVTGISRTFLAAAATVALAGGAHANTITVQAFDSTAFGNLVKSNTVVEDFETPGDLDLTFWQVVASLWHGAATIISGAPEDGVAILESALGHYEMIGAVTVRPYLRALLAHGYRTLGRREIAAETAAMALNDMQTRGERCHEPAIHALVGDLFENCEQGLREA